MSNTYFRDYPRQSVIERVLMEIDLQLSMIIEESEASRSSYIPGWEETKLEGVRELQDKICCAPLSEDEYGELIERDIKLKAEDQAKKNYLDMLYC